MKIMSQYIDLQEHPSGQEYLDGQGVLGDPVNTKESELNIIVLFVPENIVINVSLNTQRKNEN